MVKNNNFKKGVLAALLLASPLVSAETDYPAADFQPKVLYSDTDYKHSGSASDSPKSAKKAEFDANYPATNFEPKVLYQDTDYKHKKDVVAAPKSRPTSSPRSETSTGEVAPKESSDQTMLMGLIVLAAAGFFFYRKRSVPAPKSKTTPRAPVYTGGGGGLTGVAKYLSGKEGTGTGVAEYLASREGAAAVSGVAKYVAKQVGAARKVVAENATGVEKYLRNKG